MFEKCSQELVNLMETEKDRRETKLIEPGLVIEEELNIDMIPIMSQEVKTVQPCE
jgi:hypothetical protein